MSLKPQLEALVYAAESPVTLEQIVQLVKESAAAQIAAERSHEQSVEPSTEGLDAGEQIGDASAPGAPTDAEIKVRVRAELEQLIADYHGSDHGVEIRLVAGGYRMSTKPEHHDVVRAFAKSLKPPIRLSLPALETLAVIAYKQPVTVPEIGEIRGVDSTGVIATLLDRKLITTAGRKAVIGRPILYKTTKEFLLRFGLKDVSELPSMEEFEKLVQESFQSDMLPLEVAEPKVEAGEESAAPSSENLATEEAAGSAAEKEA
jgi:segregation and condensation protein B